jgi:ribosomal protein S18 acetylase RimI-like enzyme
MKIEPAEVADAEEILSLQKLAYHAEAAIYDDFSIAPLLQTIDEIKAQFGGLLFLKASSEEGEIIGSVRASVKDGTCYIGRLVVHPDVQNQGIGSKLLREIEYAFSQAERYELFTGHKSTRNLYFYSKYGYQEFRREKINEKLELVFLEKLSRST